jgi:hypothetical protein
VNEAQAGDPRHPPLPQLTSISAVQQNGSPDPSKDGACQAKVGALLGKKAVTRPPKGNPTKYGRAREAPRFRCEFMSRKTKRNAMRPPQGRARER